MDEAGIWVPANTTAPRRSRRRHRLHQLRVETEIDRAAINVLAVFGHPKGGARKDSVSCARAISRKNCCPGLADRLEDIGEKIYHTNVHLGLFPGMMIAQKYTKFIDHPVDWAVIITIGPFKGFTSMSIDEA
jgi:hypothetical protein